jgi:glutamate/aspartate transport system substrate-binding protein
MRMMRAIIRLPVIPLKVIRTSDRSPVDVVYRPSEHSHPERRGSTAQNHLDDPKENDMNKNVSLLLCTALGAVLASSAAQAAELTGTLKKIKDRNTIALAHRESSVPFSYYDDKQQVIGYSHELALKIVEAVKKELKAPNLKVTLNPVTPATRIPLVSNGTVDLECGSTTNNYERQKQVAFSNTIFLVGTRLLVKKGSGIKDFADLKGKTAVTTQGTTSERLLKKISTDQKLGIRVVSAKDHGDSFLMVESGRAAAFMMDDVLLFGEIAKSKKPGDYEVVGKPQSFEAYGCMLRKDDPQFKKLVDDTLAAVMKSGEINRIYNKWFTSPIPPRGVNMNFPLSPELAAIFKNPNDKPAE